VLGESKIRNPTICTRKQKKGVRCFGLFRRAVFDVVCLRTRSVSESAPSIARKWQNQSNEQTQRNQQKKANNDEPRPK
jgi:hypothetical protein